MKIYKMPVLLAMLLFFVVGPATAQTRAIDATFDVLEVTSGQSDLVLDYSIEAKSWKRMKRAGISPQLLFHERVEGSLVFRYAFDLKDRRGKITLPVAVYEGADRLLVSVSGFSGKSFVASSSFGSGGADGLVIKMGPRKKGKGPKHKHEYHPPEPIPEPIPEPPIDYSVLIVEACTAHAKDASKCIAEASQLEPHVAPEVVEACGKTTKWDTDLAKCMESARGWSYLAGESVMACASSSRFPSDHVKCMAAARPHTMPVASINACVAGSKFSSDHTKCLDVSSPLGDRAPGIINACSSSSKFPSDHRKCLEQAAMLR